MKDKMTIEELVDAINNELDKKDYQSEDSRVAKELTARKVRTFITDNMISAPLKDKGKNYYTREHFTQIEAILQGQREGWSKNLLKKMYMSTAIPSTTEAIATTNSYIPENSLQASALDAIAQIGQRSLMGASALLANNQPKSTDQSQEVSSVHANKNYMDAFKYRSRTWEEIPLDAEGNLFLKIEGSSKIKDVEKVLERIKTILQTRGE